MAKKLLLLQYLCPQCTNTIFVCGEKGWVGTVVDTPQKCPHCGVSQILGVIPREFHRCGQTPKGDVIIWTQFELLKLDDLNRIKMVCDPTIKSCLVTVGELEV